MDVLKKVGLTEEKAIDITKKEAKVKNAQDLQKLDRESIDEILHLLKKEDLSTRQS